MFLDCGCQLPTSTISKEPQRYCDDNGACHCRKFNGSEYTFNLERFKCDIETGKGKNFSMDYFIGTLNKLSENTLKLIYFQRCMRCNKSSVLLARTFAQTFKNTFYHRRMYNH